MHSPLCSAEADGKVGWDVAQIGDGIAVNF